MTTNSLLPLDLSARTVPDSAPVPYFGLTDGVSHQKFLVVGSLLTALFLQSFAVGFGYIVLAVVLSIGLLAFGAGCMLDETAVVIAAVVDSVAAVVDVSYLLAVIDSAEAGIAVFVVLVVDGGDAVA